MARVVRELVRPVEQARSETDLQTDIQILQVILKDSPMVVKSSTEVSRDRACLDIAAKLLNFGYSSDQIRSAIVHAQKLVAQAGANPA